MEHLKKKFVDKNKSDDTYFLYSKLKEKLGRFKTGVNVLGESQSLSRVWQHSKRGLFIFSTFHGDDEAVDLKSFAEAKGILKKVRLGYWEVDGLYTYEYPDGSKISSEELSLFVPYTEEFGTFEELVKFAKYIALDVYKQDSVFIKFPIELGGEGILYYSSGKEVNLGTNMNYDSFSDIYSTMLKRGSHKGAFVYAGDKVSKKHSKPPKGKSDRWDNRYRKNESLILSFRIPANGSETQTFHYDKINGYYE